jgi:phospholipid/cholesterol/gamma-HCH transport system substrate-binding protein
MDAQVTDSPAPDQVRSTALTAEMRDAGLGALVVLVVAVLIFTLYRGQPAAAGWPLQAHFDRVDGLLAGDGVYLAGVKVGEVVSMRLDGRFRAILQMRLDGDLRLPADTAAAVHTDGLFGRKFVALDPGGDTVTLKPGATITFTQGALRVDDLLEQIIAMGRSRQQAPAKVER